MHGSNLYFSLHKGQFNFEMVFGWTKTSRLVVKMNSFVHYLEEIDDLKNHFEMNWPLDVSTKQF